MPISSLCLSSVRRKHVGGIKAALLVTRAASLQSSLEQSTKLLLMNKHENVIHNYAEKNTNELHPLEKNVYALGLLFSGDKLKAADIQSQVKRCSVLQ